MLPQLDPTWYASQALWMLITFCATFWMMWKFVLPRMNAVLDERQRRLDDDMKKAELFKTEAENVLKEYKNAMASANEQARELLNNAQQEIAEYSKRRESEFSARLEERIKNGEDELKKTKDIALASVKDIAEGLVPQAVFKLSGLHTDENTAKSMVDDVAKEGRA